MLPQGVTIWFDGECGFCRRMSYRLRALLSLSSVPLLECQSDAQMLARMRAEKSWIVMRDGNFFYRSSALSVLLTLSPNPLFRALGWALSFRPTQRMADVAYRWTERHRGFLSRWLR